MLTTFLSLSLVLTLTLGLAGSARADDSEPTVTGGEAVHTFSEDPNLNSGFVPSLGLRSGETVLMPSGQEERPDTTLLDGNRLTTPNPEFDSIPNSQAAPENQQD